jgi:hypothetical protein
LGTWNLSTKHQNGACSQNARILYTTIKIKTFEIQCTDNVERTTAAQLKSIIPWIILYPPKVIISFVFIQFYRD